MDLDIAFRKPPADLWFLGCSIYDQIELNGLFILLEIILQAPGNLFTAFEDVFIKVFAITTLGVDALLSVICQVIYVPRGRRLRFVHGYQCVSNLVKDPEFEHSEAQSVFSDFLKQLIDSYDSVTPLSNQFIEKVPRYLIHLVLLVIIHL
jgi:hypothetical protein